MSKASRAARSWGAWELAALYSELQIDSAAFADGGVALCRLGCLGAQGASLSGPAGPDPTDERALATSFALTLCRSATELRSKRRTQAAVRLTLRMYRSSSRTLGPRSLRAAPFSVLKIVAPGRTLASVMFLKPERC
jgi:hypothetical protein